MKKALKTALWVVNYELWRWNMKLSYALFRKWQAQKDDAITWGKAADGEENTPV